MNEPKRGRGRPRREGADEQILAVTRELLRERGYRELTVDLVAERTGIAKTTIYRRWPTKGALVAAAIAPSAAPAAPQTGSREGDAIAVLREAISAVAPLAADGDPEAVEVLRTALAPYRALLRAVVADELLADLLIAPLWMRAATGEPLAASLPEELTRRIHL